MADAGGPYLVAAVLCEQVLREADGVASVIRIVDRLTRQEVGREVPKEMPPIPLSSLKAFISLKSGLARGRQVVKLVIEWPSGERDESGPEFPVLFEGEDKGVNVIIDLSGMTLSQEGLYWFDVTLDNKLLTRMPLRLEYQPVRTGGVK